jgi:Mrp family chromosome partitioning ATPase/capsular polysaccharide biosynthesis protein
MELLVILRTIRRHWVLILALTVVGAGLGVASSSFEKETRTSRTYYKATTTLVVDLTQRAGGSTANAFSSLDQVGIYTTTGAVPDAVAKKLGTDESGPQLAEHIITSTNGGTSTIAITAAEPSAEEAARLADTFAAELVTNLDQRGQDAYAKASADLQQRLTDLTNQQNDLYPRIAANPPNVDNLKAQMQALSNQYSLAFQSYSQLAAAGPPTTRFTTLQKAAPVPIDRKEYDARLALGATSRNNFTLGTEAGDAQLSDVSSSGESASVSGPLARGLLGAFLGLLLGIGIALLRERLDRRIRNRADAEAAFRLPVLAEVPQIKKQQQRERELVANTAPLSRFTEAFRAVRSSVLFTRAALDAEAGAPTRRTGNGAIPGGTLFEPDNDDPLVVMITSASPGEGKTTTTANLAAVFGEAGSSVLVVNCDFRRPAIHRFFGVEDEPRRVHETRVPGVKVVTNVLTDPASNPAQVLAAQRQVVAAARGRFDVILLDTAPLLTANDAVELVSSADMLLLVARVGITQTETAERSVDLLNRLDVPLAGVILIGMASATNDYYYYYQPGRVAPGRADDAAARSRRRPSPTNGDGRAPESEMFVPEPGSERRARTD